MLAFGTALMLRPRLLMIDEPLIRLAPMLVAQIFDAIVGIRDELRHRGTDRRAAAAADPAHRRRVFFIRAGRLISQGPADSYRGADALRQVYFSNTNREDA